MSQSDPPPSFKPGGNIGSLVGVAISASLLPPMVNGGILLGVALAEINHCSVDQSCLTPTVSPTSPLPSPSLNSSSTVDPPSNASSATSATIAVATIAPPRPVPDPHHLGCDPWGTNEYEAVFSCALPHEAALLGVTSIALTILNIACIFIMAIVVFKIKEVVPKAALSSGERWSAEVFRVL